MANKKYYIYPVLQQDADDIIPMLTEECMTVDIRKAGAYFRIHISLKYENKDIEELVSQGFAKYSCEISCSSTFMRRSFCADSPEILFDIKRDEINKAVEISARIVVTKTIPHYRNSHQNEDYDDEEFYMEPGDVLADFGSYMFVPELKLDKIYSTGSFMKIFEDKEATCPWSNIESEYIKIFLPSNMHDVFKKVYRDQRNEVIFHSSILLYFLCNAIANYEEKIHGKFAWAIALKYKIENDPGLQTKYSLGNKQDAFDLAQELLGNPFNRLFNYFRNK